MARPFAVEVRALLICTAAVDYSVVGVRTELVLVLGVITSILPLRCLAGRVVLVIS
jgi:hypothetical protein